MTNLIAQFSNEFTLHAYGIGNGVSTQLVINAANSGKGEYYFVNDKAEGLNKCVIDGLSAAMEPIFIIENVNLNVNGKLKKELKPIKEVPKTLRTGKYF